MCTLLNIIYIIPYTSNSVRNLYFPNEFNNKYGGNNVKKTNSKIYLIISVIIAALAIALIVVATSYSKVTKNDTSIANNNIIGEEENTAEEAIDSDDANTVHDNSTIGYNASARPALLSDKVILEKPSVTATTSEYSVEPNLENVYNKELYYFDDEQKDLLKNQLFFVTKPFGDYEFFEVYEQNRYYYESNFVTVDSLMHTYHLFFSHLLKNLEKKELANSVKEMSASFLAESNSQYEKLKGTEWEEAAKRNIEYFAIGAALQGVDADTALDISDVVDYEISKIKEAEGIEKCVITDEDEDYSQYSPRGYYEGDEQLESYFRTMMWYGRIQFNTKSDEMLKSSVLINIAMNDAGKEEWKDVYDITSFFVGTSDDLGFYEYFPLIQKIYGENVDIEDIVNNKEGFETFKKEAKSLRLPKINSIPINMGEDNTIQGFRLMGQRFTIDAEIMQNLIYSRVDENSEGNLRMLPDVLDVAAAFGSDIAYDLLKEQGDTDFENYSENMDKLRLDLSSDDSFEALETNLYGNWINTLRPLLERKGKGYPMFMQSDAWAKKDIETFAGSYTELKHDTILYAKQVMAEMGDGDIPELDDRGYVQPEPEVYSRFKFLADATREGLEERNRISAEDAENMKKLSELADKLYVISEKELIDEVLTDDEYDLIREYGGVLEHFWYDVTKADTGDSDINTEKYQAALIVDVATDPNGQVLEMATGKPSIIYVIVNVDGKVKIAKGSVYSFYQFAWPQEDRLTDSKWRQMMGFEPGADGFYDFDTIQNIDIPWWTKDYSYVYSW